MPSPYIGPNVLILPQIRRPAHISPTNLVDCSPTRVGAETSINLSYQENATLTCKMKNAKILDANVSLFQTILYR